MNTLTLPSFETTDLPTNRGETETLRQDTLNAWQHYQATGLHANAAEVDAWLAQLAQGHDVEPPVPGADSGGSSPTRN